MNNSLPLQNSKSLLAKHLTQELYQDLEDVQTSNGYTFTQAMQTNIDNPDSGIGIYAGDMQSYDVFSKIMIPIIEDYHAVTLAQPQSSDYDSSSKEWDMPSDSDDYIISTRIRTARNLQGFPFGGLLSPCQRAEVERAIISALNSLNGELTGSYQAITDMSCTEKESLVTQHYLFKQGDRFLASAGLNNDWPNNRGIFFNRNKDFLVWVNEEDQLRIISMQKGGNIHGVFKRLQNAVKQLSAVLDFAHHEKMGFLTSCPTNIGTGIRASVHIQLPQLARNPKQLQQLADDYHLQIRGQFGEHSTSVEPIFDVSNKRRLGLSEVECIDDLVMGVKEIIVVEKSL